jgi:hypothetical protein
MLHLDDAGCHDSRPHAARTDVRSSPARRRGYDWLRMRPVILASTVAALLLWPVGAWAEPAWVLWVEAPLGSDEWSVARIPQARFAVKDECDRRAQRLNESELAIAKMERSGGESRDVFTCLPDTVDPRPEGALR